ncbi:tetratricopeptide repeat protein [Pseudodesulfovibrio tunisiensis]|uniref:tetratricopeptide repeat protein n=1 Tax=Pseudodesulfovibrio tunisiensis TaxID=463192 RepID=UPI001FB56062|nr:tetratricopeptide repeat protein [Pseudodesulfovibrio tunisiensis]
MGQLRTLGMLNREGMSACHEGRMETALFQLDQARSMAQAMKLPLHEAKIRNNMGLVHQLSGRTSEARACFILALKATGREAPDSVLHRVIRTNLDRLGGKAEAA